MLSKEARNAFIGWESNGSTIIKASFKTKNKGMTMSDAMHPPVIALTNRLQLITEKCSAKDLIILMEDKNAKTGMDNTGYEDIMRRHGIGEGSENGERFASPCSFNKLVIDGTIFPHKRIHKATWVSLNPHRGGPVSSYLHQ
ncbi:unnamed protein product [Schistosoma margrebowiei]|uniref:Uncharacterized protein n=1 Tax=Schistosoma margrebowiei TaxID=48269 RepID=A0A183MWY0_9TREM|nr:unnamed protein product [Schistosoma margrebowiei]